MRNLAIRRVDFRPSVDLLDGEDLNLRLAGKGLRPAARALGELAKRGTCTMADVVRALAGDEPPRVTLVDVIGEVEPGRGRHEEHLHRVPIAPRRLDERGRPIGLTDPPQAFVEGITALSLLLHGDPAKVDRAAAERSVEQALVTLAKDAAEPDPDEFFDDVCKLLRWTKPDVPERREVLAELQRLLGHDKDPGGTEAAGDEQRVLKDLLAEKVSGVPKRDR